MVGSKVSVSVAPPAMVPTTTVAPDARVEVLVGAPPPPGAGITGAAVGQLLTDGCVVHEAHPMVVVPDIVSGRSGTGVSLQSIVAIKSLWNRRTFATYCNSHSCKLHLIPNRWR